MVDDKQFIISKEIISEAGWKHVALKTGYLLNWQEKLAVTYNKICSVVLIGNAWQVDPERKSPQEEVKNLSGQEYDNCTVYDMEKTWCGRYVLIVGKKIYLDTSGLMGIFYSKSNISCSLNVLSAVYNFFEK